MGKLATKIATNTLYNYLMDNYELKLARVDLGKGWIDLGYGEPLSVRNVFIKHTMLDLNMPSKAELLDSEYQPPKGLPKLVSLLEQKYAHTVVICNGARHGIAAVMYAIKKQGHNECFMHSPYWTATPNILKSQGLNVRFVDLASENNHPFLLTSPNNPDGLEISKDELVKKTQKAANNNLIFIHDAAYYTPIYSNEDVSEVHADVTIFSFAKMWGLSGLRVGYLVIKNQSLLQGITEYIEQTSSGVSTASQQIAYEVEKFFKENPEKLVPFYRECRHEIEKSREELKKLDPEYLELQQCSSNSMFAWCKKGPKFDSISAKVNVIDGEAFGKPGYVRINIAVNSDIIKNAVDRLNGNFPT